MCVIPQVVWAPLNPVPTIEHLGGGFVPRFTATRLSHFYRQFSLSLEKSLMLSLKSNSLLMTTERFLLSSQ